MVKDSGTGSLSVAALPAAAPAIPTFILSVRARLDGDFDLTMSRLREREVLYLDQPVGCFKRESYLEVNHLYQRFFETKTVDPDWQEHYVHTLGVELWYRLPAALRRYYQEEMRDLAGHASLLVVTDPGLPTFPWELVRPRETNSSNADDFLGLAFAVGHWTAGLRWRLRVDVSSFAAMTTFTKEKADAALVALQADGTAPEDEQLAGILDLVTGFKSAHYQVASLDTFLATLRADDAAQVPDIVHLATHGSADAHDGPQLTMLLGEGSVMQMTPSFVRAHARLADHDRHPVVFLNACQADVTFFRGAGSDSWAEVFCEAGCAALVAPRWVVSRKTARQAALLFYKQLAHGKSAGQALQAVRRAFYERTDDSLRSAWLAYALHGHPDLMVRLACA